MSNSIELQRLTASVETMRTSILQAYVLLKKLFICKFFFYRYLDLHEKFTKTTELQTSALTALWKRVKIHIELLKYIIGCFSVKHKV
jgi:hypothetical protein